jgi:CO/xanthine dehydrogenase FAD-binding subunit
MNGARYVEPLTVGEVVAALTENNGARCLAGGQTLVAMMNAGLIEPPLVVGLRRVAELKGIEFDATGSVVIGAMMTHAALARETRLSGAHAVLREAAATIAHPAIRNMGTLGGALSHADPNADHPPAVLAAGAEIEVVGPGGRRTIAAQSRSLRFLHRTARGRASAILPLFSGERFRNARHDDRGFGLRRQALASAAGVSRYRSDTVWFLHAGPHHCGHGALSA